MLLRDLRTATVAILVFTVLCGLAYPLAVTGVAQVAFPGSADGRLVRRDGRVVGSELIGQDFKGRPRYFQSRPSSTGYAADASAFSNAGPNSKDLRDALRQRAQAYLRRERPFTAGLTAGRIPGDAVFTSGSNLDPDISVANARIQANRVAAVRRLPKARVLALVDRAAHGRALGVFGERGVDVLRLNLALDREGRR